MERRPDTIHLYGVDRMSTQECLHYFGEYGPRRVEWLDDSSCNIVFADVNSAKRAVLGKGRPFSPGDAPDLQGGLLMPQPYVCGGGVGWRIGMGGT